jgi:hypothetical protein
MSNSTSRNGGGHLVLDDLDAGAVADDLFAVLDRADPADVEPHRGVELERVAAGGGLRAAEHDADLHAELVDEDDEGAAARDRAGELAQRLAHEARLEADVGVAHVTLELRLGGQGGDRVDDDHVEGAGADEHVADLERLLAEVRLADQEVVGAHADLAGVADVERVLGVDEGAHAPAPLRLGDHVQGQGGLARRLRAVDLDDATAREAADPERDVEPERAGGDHADVAERHLAVLGEPHDRALAKLLLDGREREVDGGVALVLRGGRGRCRCHGGSTLTARARSRYAALGARNAASRG